MSRVRDLNLFHAVHHATAERLKAGRAPDLVVFPHSLGFVRAVDREYLTNRFKQFDPQTVPANLQVRDALRDRNRFSGLTPSHAGGGIQTGGVYFSRHPAALLNELRNYSGRRKPITKVLARKGVISLEVVQCMQLLDLSAYSHHTSRFLTDIAQDSDVQDAMRHNNLVQQGLRFKQLLLHPNDYTVARAIGLAVAENHQLDGVQFRTARDSDRPGESGDNVVLYGPDGRVVTKKAVAATVTLFRYDGKSREVTPDVYHVEPSNDTYVTTSSDAGDATSTTK